MAINFLNTVAVDDNVLFVDTTNDRVGIGTGSPNQKLEVSAATDTAISIASSDTSLNAGQNVGILEFSSNNETSLSQAYTPFSKIKTISESAVTGTASVNGAIIFETASTNTVSERMRITSGGKVGIGLTNPIAKLHVYQNDTEVDTEAGVTIEQDGTGDAALSFLLTGTKRWRMGIDNNDSDKFKISDSTNLASDNKLTIDTSGNVGIGTTSPGVKLDIVGSTIGLRVRQANLSDVLRVYTQGSGIFMDNGDVHISDDLKIGSTLLSNQENTDIDSAAAEVVAQVAHATYTAAFFDFVVKKGTNVRSGTVYACHNGDTTPLVEFTETSTQDLGDTSDVVLSVDISGTQMRLMATVASDDWSVKSLVKAI